MILFALAALLAQDIAPVKEWVRGGHAFYTVRDSKFGECFINVLPAVDFAGTAAEWHERIRGELAQAMGASKEGASEDAGAWKAFATVGEKDGQKRWFTLFTALGEGRGYMVLLVAATEALHEAHAASAKEMMSRAKASPPAVAGGLRYRVPSGWFTRDAEAGTVQYIPPDLPQGADVSITVAPAKPSQVPPDSSINEFTFNMFMNKTDPAYQEGIITPIGGFRMAFTRAKSGRLIVIYGARWAQSVQLVFFSAGSQELYTRYLGAIEGMIRKTEVPGFKPDPNAWHPAPIPPAERDVKIVAAYFGAGLDTRFSVEGGVASRNQQEALVLFENGIAVRADIVNSGKLDTTYLAEGFATLDVADMKVLPGRRFGRWKEADGKVTVQMFQGQPLELTREGENLKGSYLWNRMKPVDGLKPAGTFRRAMPNGQPQSITLKVDGTFESSSLNEIMGGRLVNPDFPELGRGTYEIRKWSLILRFDTGFVQSLNLMTDDQPEPKKLMLRGIVFDRMP